MIVVGTKLDATTDRARLEKLRDFCASRGIEFHAISAASGEGIPQLVRAMADALDRLPKPQQPHADDRPVVELGNPAVESASASFSPHPEKH